MNLRSLVHGMGYRYRLHVKDLPGKPDLVFSSRYKVIFVHGCFWHGHECARGSLSSKSNSECWANKISGNILCDKRHILELKKLGWAVCII